MTDDHDDDAFDGDFDDEYDGDDEEFDGPLDDLESELVRRDLDDLQDFEAVFTEEGYRGVSVFCRDCDEDHYYPWDMLRENLTSLLATGETPVHEPAFQPEPAQYVPWEYAHGYVDALREAGVFERHLVGECGRCGFVLPEPLAGANWCPRCGTPLLRQRLRQALTDVLDDDQVDAVLRRAGLPD